MFLHGWGGGVVSFLPVAQRMKDCDCLLFDFKGFGESPEEGVRSLEDYAEDVLSLMDEIGIKEAVLIGHSFGCRVGAYIAANYPERVLGFVITDGAGLKPRRGLKYYLKVYLHKFKRKLGFDLSKDGSADYRALSPVMKKTFVNVVNRYTENECARIKCPTLICWGKKDKDTPLYMAKRFLKLIKDSALILFEGGHFCYIDELARYTTIAKKFISEVAYGVGRGGAERRSDDCSRSQNS